MVERINSPRVLGKTLKGPSNVNRELVIPSICHLIHSPVPSKTTKRLLEFHRAINTIPL